MRHLVCISTMVAMATIALGQAASSQAKAAPAAQKASATISWTQPKTPWGDPDLQGTWTKLTRLQSVIKFS